MTISWKQFGPLYHGTSRRGLETISQGQGGGPRYTSMQNSWGWNYATTDIELAKQYARDAALMDTRNSRTGEVFSPTVYEVSPSANTYSYDGKRYRHGWGPDPDSGPFGFGDGPKNRREALEIHEGGEPVSLRFEAPLKAKEVWAEDDK